MLDFVGLFFCFLSVCCCFCCHCSFLGQRERECVLVCVCVCVCVCVHVCVGMCAAVCNLL